MKRFFESHPDAVAIAVLVLLLLVPAPGAAKTKLQLTLANARQPDGSLLKLEQRGERVWQRLEDRMRRFEDRFQQLTPPRGRRVNNEEVDSE